MATQDYIIHLRKGIKFTLTGVASEVKEDVEVYERDNYRDVMDSNYVGFHLASTDWLGLQSAGGGGKGCDILEHVSPRQEMKKRTRYVWKNAGTDVLGWAWEDEIISIGVGAPTRI